MREMEKKNMMERENAFGIQFSPFQHTIIDIASLKLIS